MGLAWRRCLIGRFERLDEAPLLKDTCGFHHCRRIVASPKRRIYSPGAFYFPMEQSKLSSNVFVMNDFFLIYHDLFVNTLSFPQTGSIPIKENVIPERIRISVPSSKEYLRRMNLDHFILLIFF